MPDLPTITVTQTQADRMLAAYGSVAAYRDWLRKSIIEYVIAKENFDVENSFRQQRILAAAQARAELESGGGSAP